MDELADRVYVIKAGDRNPDADTNAETNTVLQQLLTLLLEGNNR